MSQFSLDLSAYIAKAKANIDIVTRVAILDVGKRLVERSPVGDGRLWKSPPPPGYVGGRFRGSWDASVDAPPSAMLRTIDPTGAASNGRIFAAVPDKASGKVYYIVNNTPYAQTLEQGHSTQAPFGMVALTVVEWRNIVDDAVNKNRGSGSMADGLKAYPV